MTREDYETLSQDRRAMLASMKGLHDGGVRIDTGGLDNLSAVGIGSLGSGGKLDMPEIKEKEDTTEEGSIELNVGRKDRQAHGTQSRMNTMKLGKSYGSRWSQTDQSPGRVLKATGADRDIQGMITGDKASRSNMMVPHILDEAVYGGKEFMSVRPPQTTTHNEYATQGKVNQRYQRIRSAISTGSTTNQRALNRKQSHSNKEIQSATQ